jgi:hypothetical protein
MLRTSSFDRRGSMSAKARLAVLVVAALLVACSSVLRRASQRFADRLTEAILDQDDIGTVHDGVPAYLLLIDSLILGDPADPDTLLAGATLYGAYASGLVADQDRARRLAQRAYDYGRRALCLRERELCATLAAPFDRFAPALARTAPRDLALLYGFASAWAGVIELDPGNWQNIADLPKLEALLQRIVALDPRYDGGGAYLYLGVLHSLRPASLGGDPEQGKAYFEQALAYSGGRNQMVRVLYAQFYARLVFDQQLHDRLLNEVLAADPVAPRLTLINVLAKQRARALLASGKEYF